MRHAPTSMKCGNCFFHLDNNVCRRYPPQMLVTSDGHHRGQWPDTGINDWCGEFQPSPVEANQLPQGFQPKAKFP